MRSSHRMPSCRLPMRSATYAAVRSGPGALLRITADTASSARPPSTVSISRPGVAERPKPRFAVGDRSKDVQQIPCRSGQAVEPGHHQHVSCVNLVKRLAQLGAVGFGSAGRFAKHLLASGLGQLAHLRLNALAVRGDPCIPIFHGLDMHLINAPEKPLNFNMPNLVHIS